MMKPTIIILAVISLVFVCGCADIPYVDDGDTIDEYNEHINTWNRDITKYQIYHSAYNDELDNYNHEIDVYNAALWGDSAKLKVAKSRLSDAQNDYKYNAMIIKGRLEMFRTFIYSNISVLNRNGIDSHKMLNDINELISEIDYNIQFSGI